MKEKAKAATKFSAATSSTSLLGPEEQKLQGVQAALRDARVARERALETASQADARVRRWDGEIERLEALEKELKERC